MSRWSPGQALDARRTLTAAFRADCRRLWPISTRKRLARDLGISASYAAKLMSGERLISRRLYDRWERRDG